MVAMYPSKAYPITLTLLHSEQPKLHRVLAVLSAIGLIGKSICTYYGSKVELFKVLLLRFNSL